MAIADDANQLRALADELNTAIIGMVMQIDDPMAGLLARAQGILGGIPVADEVAGMFGQNGELRSNVISHISMMQQQIHEIANRIMNAGGGS